MASANNCSDKYFKLSCLYRKFVPCSCCAAVALGKGKTSQVKQRESDYSLSTLSLSYIMTSIYP